MSDRSVINMVIGWGSLIEYWIASGPNQPDWLICVPFFSLGVFLANLIRGN